MIWLGKLICRISDAVVIFGCAGLAVLIIVVLAG
jgi:hypothetical protein